MTFKTIFAAGLTALGLFAAVPAAEAKTQLYLNFNAGPGYGNDCRWFRGEYRCHGPRFYNGGMPLWDNDPYVDGPFFDDSASDRLACGEARFMLRERGFRNLTSVDCSGNSYVFRATKQGIPYRVRVNAYSGKFVANAY
ncbi:MAG: hypothetical protein U1E15_08385 [Hyphomicrobiales bacterium]